MNFRQTMAELKQLGTAQNVKVYKRHGAGENLFGVSFANLKLLRRKIGTDHDLASKLWATGNTDAMTLATMVADPAQMSGAEADAWLKGVEYHLVAGLLAKVVAQTTFARSRIRKWTRVKRENTRTAGYCLVAEVLSQAPDALSDEDCLGLVRTTEAEIHESANRARYAMNGALIAIGATRPAIRRQVIAAARRIGQVEVDHGETGCQTPDAVSYIEKAAARRQTPRSKPRSSQPTARKTVKAHASAKRGPKPATRRAASK